MIATDKEFGVPVKLSLSLFDANGNEMAVDTELTWPLWHELRGNMWIQQDVETLLDRVFAPIVARLKARTAHLGPADASGA